MRHRLQLFHTGNPKLQWGLRTLDDIPAGTFVCSYLGHVYTEKGAEKVLGVESLDKGCFWDLSFCPLERGCPSLEVNNAEL